MINDKEGERKNNPCAISINIKIFVTLLKDHAGCASARICFADHARKSVQYRIYSDNHKNKSETALHYVCYTPRI